MSGTVQRLGRYRTSNGPDRADVGSNQQVVSDTNPMQPSGSTDYIAYSMGAWMGHDGTQAVARLGIFSRVADGGAPGGARPSVLNGRTAEATLNTPYIGGSGGASTTINLETPVVIRSNENIAVGVAARSSGVGIGMFQASAISEPNEYFYRQGIGGTDFETVNGGSGTNQGQLAIWVNAEANVRPNTPGVVARSGSDTRPTMTSTFSDPNEALNNGAAFDELTSHRHTVSWGGAERWSATYSANATEKSQKRSIRQIGVTVPFETTITYTVEHRDRLGLWSVVRSHTWSVSNPANAPDPPTGLLPSGTITGTLNPVMSLVHRDQDGSSSSQLRVQVMTANGDTMLWDQRFTFNAPANERGRFSYNGVGLNFYTNYRWRAQLWDTTGLEGGWSDWVNFSIQHTNRDPNPPSNVDPPIGRVYGSRDITMRMDFTDPDLPVLPDGQAWEQFTAKQVVVRRASDNVQVFNTGVTPTSTWEKNNLRTSTAITLPAWDTWYRREERHRDRSGAWSAWVLANIMAVAGVSVDKPSQPSGRITTPTNLGVIKAVYRHTGGLSGTRIRVGVFSDTGALISQRETSISVTPGSEIQTTFNALWGGDGFPFVEGTDYQYAIAARDSGNNWSAWSDFQQLRINGRPNIPILYNPKEGTVSPTLPMTIVVVTDPDQPSTELTVTAEFYDADTDALIGTRTLPNINGTTSFGYVPSDVITGYRNVKWRAQASDGALTSSWSDMFTFSFQPVPDVTITSPTSSPVTTSRPMFTWTASDQQAWRLRGYDGERVVYDTGIIASGVQQHPIFTESYWQGGERWNNHETFDWVVSVRDSSTLWGDSDVLTLTLEYIPPDPLVVESVESLAFYGAEGTQYAEMSTSQPNATEEVFIRTLIDRVEIDGPDGNEIPGTMIHGYFETGNSSDTTFADFDMTSNQWYRYAFRYEVQSGFDVIESDPVYAEALISFWGTLLHMPFDPLNNYVWLPYNEGEYAPELSMAQGQYDVMARGGRAPYGYTNRESHVEWSCESSLIDIGDYTAKVQYDALLNIWQRQSATYSPTGRPETVCFREGRGGRFGRIYGRMSEPVISHRAYPDYSLGFRFRELDERPVGGFEQ